ncbi:TonB-dependent receptor [Pseudomonas sp. Q2-TVG4-2]|uniref:TonB-dependent receptor n=1 Tax=Pseudomonas sp. Q2-TVG4-2 TaxID=1685699 RepID=UPI0015E6448E|nr:TonB-dependent receptor [Pseudomonas sp. Q2-TVG4-2]
MPSLISLFRPSLLAVAIAFAPLPLLAQSASDSAATVDDVREYALPAAPLATTLNRIAAEAGLVLSIDPALTRERMAQPVQGRFDGQGALREALRGTGLELRQANPGSYSVQPAPTDAMALPDVTVTASEPLVEGSEDSGYRTTTARNVGALGGMALQDAPYSISVVSSDMLRNTQTTSTDEVFKRNPFTQLYSPKNAGYASAVAIRGFSDAGNLSIANDGLRFSTGYDSGNFVEEMEQIEVLTGLSGFLYGPASPGGLVNYVLKRPTYERYNSVTLGNAGGENYYLHGDFGGKVDDQGIFAYRLNMLTQDGETAIDMQKRRRQMISLALDWNVSDDLLIQFDASHKENETHGLTSYWFVADGSRRPSASDLDNDKLYSQRWAISDSEHDRVGSRFNWRLSDVFTLRGALAYAEYTDEYVYTGPTIDASTPTGTYAQPLYAFAPVDNEETSANLFLDSVFQTGPLGHKLTVGYQGSSLRTKQHTDHVPFGFQWNSVVGNVPIGEAPQVGKPAYNIGNSSKHLSATSDLSSVLIGDVITFNPQWSTILGVVHSKIETFSNDFVYGTGVTEYEKSETSPNVSLIYKPVPWLTTYASYIEGLEAGGSTSVFPGGPTVSLPPEVSEQYEIGAKALWGDALFTVALFNIDKPNYITNFVYTPNGRQENTGIEFGVTGKVTPALTLVGGLTLLDASVNNSSVAANNGNKPTNVASKLAKLYAEYDVASAPGFAVTGGAYYTGKQYSDAENQYSLSSFTTFDLGARYRMPVAGNTLTLRANVSNLTDKEYWLNSHYLGDPRTLTFSGQLEF